MKTILSFVGGGDRDPVILQTALAAARPLGAHLEVLHLRVPATQAARYSNTEFASGAALRNAFQRLAANASTFSELAAQHVQEFCAQANIALCDAPAAAQGLTASFREEEDNALERLTSLARHSDLTVMGRSKQTQGLAPQTLEHLMMNCGRPILVAASHAPQSFRTVMVCWKECSNAARALTAATPILATAERVVFAGIAEQDGLKDELEDLARQFAWNGVACEVRVLSPSRSGTSAVLAAAAEECGADLVVMGAYGRSRAHELIFGSCTAAVLEGSDRPIFLMH